MRLTHLLPALLLLTATVAMPACVKQQVLHQTEAPAADPDFIDLEASVAQRYVTADADGTVLARLRVRVDGDLHMPRPPANVALVMDTSASMGGDAIDKTRSAALTLIDSLQDGDMISVVAFGSGPEIIAPATVVNEASKAKIRTAIGGIEAHGTTDLTGGLATGLAELAKFRAPGGEQLNRVVLLSDGVPNDPSQLPALASQAASYAAPITALGLGLDFNETLLAELARTSGGRFQYVEEPTELAAMFRDEMLDLDRVVAQNVYLQLSPGPDVVIAEVLGLPASDSGRGKTVSLGNLLEGQEHDIIVRLQAGGHAPGSTVELLDASLSFAYAGQGFSRNAFLSTTASSDPAEVAKGIDAGVLVAAARAETAAATLRVIEMARAGLLAEAKQELKIAKTEASDAIEQFDDDELAELAADLDKLEETLPELVPAAAPPNGPLASPTYDEAGGPYAEPPVAYEASDDAMAPSMQPASPKVKRDRARHNRRAHSRAYKTLAPRMAQ
jgi:Ca-activated chloride channel family protein